MTFADVNSSLVGGARLVRAVISTPRKMSRNQIRWTIAASLLVGIVFATLSYFRLLHLTHIVHIDNVVFGADAFENFNAISSGHYANVGASKHALAEIVFALLADPQKWLGVSPDGSAVNTMALLVGVLGAAFFVLCIRIGASVLLSFASCLLLFSTNAFAFQTSIFETYILTELMTVCAFLLFLDLAYHVAARPSWCAIFAGAAAGFAGLANTPAAAIVLVYSSIAWSRTDRRFRCARVLVSVIVPCAISVFIALSPSVLRDVIHHEWPLHWMRQEANEWASFGHFDNIPLAMDYILTASIFSWVSVGVEPICRYITSDLTQLAHDPWALFGLIGGLGLVAYAARRIVKDPGALPLAAGLVVARGAFFAFYWYYNPWESMLYSSQWMLLVVCLVVLGLRRTRWAPVAVLVVAVALLVPNEPLNWPARDTFASSCPADHLPPWEQGPNAANTRSH